MSSLTIKHKTKYNLLKINQSSSLLLKKISSYPSSSTSAFFSDSLGLDEGL